MSLDITRNFVENRDGTYDLYEVPKVDVENVEDGKINKQMPIRPFELKTYLKVGMYIVYGTIPEHYSWNSTYTILKYTVLYRNLFQF